MILLSELSRRRIRSIQKLIRVGRNEVVVVLRVDKEKGMFVFSIDRLWLFAEYVGNIAQDTSIYLNVVSLRKILQNAKNDI
jgi:hypothetical protein